MGRRRKTTEEFIEEARVVHGNKYDYSLAKINGFNKAKAEIKCNTCGLIFKQRIDSHLNGCGCPKCAKERSKKTQRITKEEFMTKAIEKHGNKYDYSLVEISGNSFTKVKIKCNTCGALFEQSINNHLHGQGCPECAKEKNIELLRINTKLKTKTEGEFITEARRRHGSKYDYSKVNYINNATKVCIICTKHGEFWQLPTAHLNGHGCDKCAKEMQSILFRDSTNDFIVKARAVHGNKYDYSFVNYINDRIPVEIKCNKCGCVFTQKPNNHKNGQGCPHCNFSSLEEKVEILLKQYNIIYEPQKRFPWLKSKRSMSLDFYLPEFNVAIECQGVQHYLEKESGFFTKEKVLYTQLNDKLKHDICKEHSILIYYIRYDDNVEEKVKWLLFSIR